MCGDAKNPTSFLAGAIGSQACSAGTMLDVSRLKPDAEAAQEHIGYSVKL